jgi:Flp pilus assembly protein TadG
MMMFVLMMFVLMMLVMVGVGMSRFLNEKTSAREATAYGALCL